MIGLNIGCGPNYLKSDKVEWINTDIRTDAGFKVDEHWDFLKPIPLEDNSVDFILAWHVIEHMPMQDVSNILKDWYRVLKTGGRLFIACPDMESIAHHIINRDGPWADWYICMVNVFGPFNGSIGDLHRWSYNYEELRKKIDEAGLVDYHRLTHTELFNIIGIKHEEKVGFADHNLQISASKP